jgi:plasmid segregation protein ParM
MAFARYASTSPLFFLTLFLLNPYRRTFMVTSIVRGLDTGFGSTKLVMSHTPGSDSQCKLFPSLAPLSINLDLSGGGVIARRDTVLVQVDGNNYEVGPDVELALNTHASRIMHQNFLETSEYLALFRGALSYMHASRIDLLVVGLPVSLLPTKADYLKQRLEGTHPVADGQTVTVNKVLVLAQPLGGFIHYSLTHGLYSQLREAKNLVIDPGFFTVDWILAKGIQPIPRRCGSFAGGMHSVLRRLAQVISDEYQVNFDDYGALDRALRNGKLRIFGNDVDVEKYIPQAKPVVEEAVNAIVNSVGDGRDIDSIVLVGGGAPFFRAAIEHRFPSHRVWLVPDPVFSNVRGFQLAGEEIMHRKLVTVA